LAVYREMDIGTAKPTRPADPASRHEWAMVDLADASKEFSVALFQKEGKRAIARLHEQKKAAVLVGGTGLYHRALVDSLSLPACFPAIRRRLYQEAAAEGGAARLHARLAELDPVAAGRMEPLNIRRVVRALEVTEGSGRCFSEFGPGLSAYEASATVMVGLRLERQELDRRLAERLHEMMEEGFLDEVARLAERPGGLSRTARQAIGYGELLAHLEGELSLEVALAASLRRLKRFARRQESWFRRDPRVEWFPAEADDLADLVIRRWETGLS
jgi:tRNA dimethylallyltransferase